MTELSFVSAVIRFPRGLKMYFFSRHLGLLIHENPASEILRRPVTKDNVGEFDAFVKEKGLVPKDAHLDGVFYTPNRDGFAVRWWHPTFKEIEHYNLIEEVIVTEEMLGFKSLRSMAEVR